jgi:chemotaxis protein CheX
VASIFETSTYETTTAQIVRDVFQTMLRYEIHESSDDYKSRTSVVTSAIFFAGSWKGAVVLECSEAQARFLTGRLMDIPEPPRMDNDTRDAMGEVVNMIGGNLKSVLPPGVGLSMPSVLEGADYAYRICGSNELVRFSFCGDAGHLWITLFQVIED